MKESYIERKERYIKEGKCMHCSKPIIDKGIFGGTTCCRDCIIKNNNQYKLRAINYRTNKQCPKHPYNDIVSGKKFCAKCLWYAILYNNPSLSDEHITKILERQNYICPITGYKLEKGINASIDHIIPVGRERYNKEHELNNINNIRIIDDRVNRWKEDIPDEEFIKVCRDIVNHQDKLKEDRNGKGNI